MNASPAPGSDAGPDAGPGTDSVPDTGPDAGPDAGAADRTDRTPEAPPGPGADRLTTWAWRIGAFSLLGMCCVLTAVPAAITSVAGIVVSTLALIRSRRTGGRRLKALGGLAMSLVALSVVLLGLLALRSR